MEFFNARGASPTVTQVKVFVRVHPDCDLPTDVLRWLDKDRSHVNEARQRLLATVNDEEDEP